MRKKKKERKASLAQHICSCGKQCAKMRLEYSSSESVYCNVIVPIKLEKKKTFIGVCFVVQLSNKLLHFLFEYASTWLMANILLQLGNEVHRFILELPIPKFRRWEKYYKSTISAILHTMQEEFEKISTEQDELPYFSNKFDLLIKQRHLYELFESQQYYRNFLPYTHREILPKMFCLNFYPIKLCYMWTSF